MFDKTITLLPYYLNVINLLTSTVFAVDGYGLIGSIANVVYFFEQMWIILIISRCIHNKVFLTDGTT